MDGKIRGFTLIELLVVVIVVSLMATMATIYIREFRISSGLKEAVNKIATDLSYIKSLSVATDSVWILCFMDEDGDSYYDAYRIVGDRNADMSINTDDCSSTDVNDIVKEKGTLPRTVRTSLSPNTRIVGFSKKGITVIDNGGTYSNFALRIDIVSKIDSSRKKTITINTAGRVDYQ